MLLSLLRSIRTRLVLLVLISLVPALGIIVYAGLEGRRAAIRNAENEAMMTLGSLALEQERAVEATRTLLMALSEVEQIRALDVPALGRIFEKLLAQNPIYASLFMVDAEGAIVSSAIPFVPGNVRDRKVFRDCVRTKDFSVGEYAIGGTTKRPVLHFGYPVLDPKGRIKGIIIAAVDLGRYGELFVKATLPKDSVMSIIDHRGVRLFRYPDTEQHGRMGTEFDPGRMKRMMEGPDQGMLRTTGIDYYGVYRKFRLKQEDSPYAFIILRISEKETLRGAERVFSTSLILMLIAFLVAFLCALLIGDATIAKKLGRLVSVSMELGRGNLKVRTGLDHVGGELGELAKSFDEMAEGMEQEDLARKQVEEALRQSEEQYRRIFENATEGIFQSIQTVQGGHFISVNPAMARIHGYITPEEMKADVTNIEEQLWVDRARRSEYRRLLDEQGVVTNFESASYRKDGSTIWVSLSARAVRDADGTLLWYEGIVEDITSRKQAEESLKESELKYRALIETTDTGFVILRGDGVVLDANQEYVRLAGYEAVDQIVGRNVLEWTAAQDIERNGREVKRCFEEGCARNLEIDYVDRNGGLTPIEVNATVIEASTGPVIVSLCRDITQRKEAERALKESEEKYRNIFENAIMGIVRVAPDGDLLAVNSAHARMYGYDSPEEMLRSGLDLAEERYVDSEDRKRMIELLEKQGYVEGFESERYRKDGSRFWVSINGRLVRDREGRVLYYEGTSEDITSRKQAEEDRARLESQLLQSQKMEAVGTLAGGIAHDFNNILTVMTGYGTLLQMEMNLEDPLRMYVDQILSASQKAANLTQSLLSFSRQQPISLQPIDLNDVVRGTEKLLRRLLSEDIALQTSLSDRSMIVMADAIQIDQILFNLATNARDAMPRGGKLTIETEAIELGRQPLQAPGFIAPGRYALLTVSDTGVGMDENTKEHIFDPFFTTKEVGKGTGLGLSTVYGVVKQHNGYIIVSSSKGKGTTFSIYFPIVRAAAIEEEPSLSSARGGEETILIAEDNDSVRLLIKDVLAGYGYSPVEAGDGEDALLKFGLHRQIDLVIMDSVMPKMNGREVYDEIRKTNPDIKVLFTSGYTRDVVLDKGIEAKQLDFLSKPIKPEDLLRKVREILDR